jgi:hypothetical protein
MAGDEFEVTYPCYLPQGKSEGETYLTIISGGNECLPILTDDENVERFFRSKYPKEAKIKIKTLTIPGREMLISVLEQFEEGRKLGKHDITHVAFDPVDKPIVPSTTLAEFIEYLQDA